MNENVDLAVQEAQEIKIRDDDHYLQASAVLVQLAGLQEEVKAHHAEMISTQKSALQLVKDRQDKYLKPMAKAEAILKRKLLKYEDENGKAPKAEGCVRQNRMNPVVLDDEKIPLEYLEVDGSLVDEHPARLEILADIPRDCLVPSTKRLKQVANEMGELAKVPGLAVESKKLLLVKRKREVK